MVQINYIDCTTERNGTGTIACEIPPGVPTGIITVPKNWELDLTTGTFDTDYIKGQIKAGNFTPYLNSIDYEDTSEAKDVFTSSTKVRLKTVNGKPGFSLHFSKGYHFHSAAYGANSFNDVDGLLCYDNGVIFAVNTGNNSIKGHTIGMFDTENFMHAKGGDPQKTIVEFQLTNPAEYNLQGALMDPTANAFNLSLITGVVDTNIQMVSNATTEVIVKVTAAANGALGIAGLTDVNFKPSGTAATVTTAVYNTTLNDGTYTLTMSVDVSTEFAAETLGFRLWDDTDSTYVVEVANVLYQGRQVY